MSFPTKTSERDLPFIYIFEEAMKTSTEVTLLVALFVICCCSFVVDAASLNENRPTIHENIKNYDISAIEPIYPHVEVDPFHSVSLSIDTHGKSFPLTLTQHSSRIFADTKVHVIGDNGTQTIRPLDKKKMYEGHVVDKPFVSSAFFVFMEDGTIEGFIRVDGEKYMIEPMKKYRDVDFSEVTCSSKEKCNHVIHKASDVDTSHVNASTCGAVNAPQKESIGTDLNKWYYKSLEPDFAKADLLPVNSVAKYKSLFNGPRPHPKKRARRAFSESRPACNVEIVADQYFYNSPHGQSNLATTENFVLSVLADVDKIYSSTEFGDFTGVHLTVGDLKIFTTADAPGNLVGASSTSNAGSVLDDFSSQTHADYCIAHLFTYRDFQQGILGLAFVGGPNIAGGICGGTDRNGGSANTGLSTFINFGNTIDKVSGMLTVAHEIGHNFGSGHDPVERGPCSPGNPDGEYIMFPSAQGNSRVNNDKFSECSRLAIAANLATNNANCFVEGAAECGNGVREFDEECDCGATDEECAQKDPCCDRLTCKVKSNVQCSPESSPCCTNSCQFAGSDVQCQAKTECAEASVCNGLSGECPTPVAINNVTCNGESAMCANGTCSGSICPLWNLTHCDCSDSCVVCCQDPSTNECKTTSELATYLDYVSVKYLPANSKCDLGLCDNKGVCVKADDDEEPLQQIWDWISENWWILVIAAVGFIVVCIALYFLCSKRKATKAVRSSGRVNAQRSMSYNQGYSAEYAYDPPARLPTEPQTAVYPTNYQYQR
eukprot:Nk52_evm24s287 gene=Nk52_evmTU24s287